MPDREIVTVTRACEILSVSRRTIYNWMKDNRVEYIYTPSGTRRIYLDTLFRRSPPSPERIAS